MIHIIDLWCGGDSSHVSSEVCREKDATPRSKREDFTVLAEVIVERRETSVKPLEVGPDFPIFGLQPGEGGLY